MAHIDPAAPVSWWRRVLAWEPVLVQAVARAVFALAAAVGFTVSDAIQGQVAAAIIAFYLVVETVTTLVARNRVTPDTKVLERYTEVVDTAGDPVAVVVAGPANEHVAPGNIVRAYDGS